MNYDSISKKPLCGKRKHLEIQRDIPLTELAPCPYCFVISFCLVYMNMFARFDENRAITFQNIKETKCYGQIDGWTHNMKTVYPPQTKLAVV